MTGKRFSFDDGIIWENISQNSRIEIFPQKAVELLNVLNDENEQLQSEVSKLTDLLASEIEKNAKLLQENNSLKIENMRLKELKE